MSAVGSRHARTRRRPPAATASAGPASTSARACGPTWPSSPTPRWRAVSTSSSCARRDRTARSRRGPSCAALEVLAEACARHGALLAVNDRADVALAVGRRRPAPRAGRPPRRRGRGAMVGEDVLIGRSSHSADETAAAADEPGVDYFCVGPCWPTPTKPGRPAPGLDLVRTVAARAPDPAVVRDRRHRRGPPRRRARGGRAAHRRRAGDHRGRRPRGRRRPPARPAPRLTQRGAKPAERTSHP